jgi:hypothetical protein
MVWYGMVWYGMVWYIYDMVSIGGKCEEEVKMLSLDLFGVILRKI